MGAQIQILPESLCNKIAAGEVVERPASVVKELLENALDAGATEILLEVEKGGKRLIRVTDDGCGMSRDDAFLSLERHATSKVRSDEDLFRLQTLGFRGEALPSIASVSRLNLRTRSGEGEEGWEIYAEGGTVKKAGAVGSPEGTSIEVRNLFFNTPARRKFLRRDETELGHVADVATKLALAHPEVQVKVVHNGRTLIEAYRQGSLEERVGALLGRPLLDELLAVATDDGEGLQLQGLVSQPGANRSTTGAMYVFINGRYIRDRVVQHAVLEGYRHLLPKGRYPVVVLFLALEPELVDVNVHPTKHEVRFREQGRVHDFIAASVRETLRPSGWLAGATEASRQPASGSQGAEPAERRREGVREALQQYARRPDSPAPAPGPAPPPEKTGTLPLNGEKTAPGGGFFSALRILGQYGRSYIVCQDGDDLVLVDQHAAHERIGFERLRQQYRQGKVEEQTLLFPVVVELDHREGTVLGERLEELRCLGFEVEPFGGKTFALKAVPRILAEADAEKLLRDVAAELAAIGKSSAIEEAIDELLILMACHGVIRANQSLTRPEMEALLKDLDTVDFSAHCPHGRPVMKRLTLAEVERMFKRS